MNTISTEAKEKNGTGKWCTYMKSAPRENTSGANQRPPTDGTPLLSGHVVNQGVVNDCL